MDKDAVNQEVFYLKRRVDALKGLINDQFYTMIQFCQSLPMGGEELLEELLRAFAIYHTKTSIQSDLFNDSYTFPGRKLSAIEALEFVYDIHVKEKIVATEMARVEGNDDQFTVYYNAKSCFYNGHCETLVCDGMSCICVRRFCYEGMFKVMSNQEYRSTIDTPLLDHEFCAFTFTKQKEAVNNPEKIKFTIAETVRENIRLRKTVQKKLHQSEERLHLISSSLEQSGEAIFLTDQLGTIEYINPAFTRITGYTADEVIGQNPRILKSGNQNTDFYKNMWDTINNGKTWNGEVIDKKKDGSFYPARLTISPVFNDNGEITHFIGIHVDLTEQQNLEEQFRQAQKMEAIGTLVGGIAHDFNNMLAGMTGNLYLAKRKTESLPEVKMKLDNIEALAFRASDMISQLLTFARKGRVAMESLSLTPFIKEALKLLEASVPENIQLNHTLCNEPLQVYADQTQIHQMMMNLIHNARDSLEGTAKPEINIKFEPFIADDAFISKRPYQINGKDFARLSVTDNGCGIPNHQIASIFDPFFTTKEQGKGTGLGLAMVYGSVKMHKGFVEVESEENVGTTFHIYLPLTAEDNQESLETVDTRVVAKGHGELILLVDDEQHVLETGKEVLESMNFRVLTASNGQQAVDLFRTRPGDIDLLILDIVMPVMGGNEAARRIRAIREEVKVIFATGYDKNTPLNQDAGMENETVLSKPFSIIELSHIIRKKLNN